MAFGATLRAPHGGIWVLPLIGNFLLFLVALVVGVLVMTAIVVALKSRDRTLRRSTRPLRSDQGCPDAAPIRRTTASNEGARPMATRTVTIASSVGLHARPAALFVEAASSTGLDVEIAKPGEDPVDATSILGVMALGRQVRRGGRPDRRG